MSQPAFTDQLLRHQVLVQRLSADEINKFAPFRLGVLLANVDAQLAGIFDNYSSALLRDLSLFARHEAMFSGGVLSNTSTFEAAVPDYTQLYKAIRDTPLGIRDSGRGALLRDFIDTWVASEIRAIEGTIRRGVFESKASAEIIAELRGTPERRHQDGLLNVVRRHAEAVVRTAVQHAATVARAALDGEQFAIGVGPRSPLHIGCRCPMLPVLSLKYQHLDSEAHGTDGSFYEWLKAQPAEFQDLAIGTKYGALLRGGGLSALRFSTLQLDKNFVPMTLDEMRGIEPIASQQAA